ncbi:MAG: hypothetical protein ACK56I_28995, partial [bacterium]
MATRRPVRRQARLPLEMRSPTSDVVSISETGRQTMSSKGRYHDCWQGKKHPSPRLKLPPTVTL